MQGESPLTWPVGWKRARRRSRSRLDPRGMLSTARAIEELTHELERRAGARNVVLSSNLDLRLDGTPRSNQRRLDDPGVAVYFRRNGEDIVLACDRWDRIEHNIRAITKHVEAMRGQERWGVGSLDQAFTAYRALPPQGGSSAPDWRVTLGVQNGEAVDADRLRSLYRAAAKRAHPDTGGSSQDFQRLQDALASAEQELNLR